MKKRVMLTYPASETEKPLVSRLIRDLGIEVNIYRASVSPDNGGHLVVDLEGPEERIAEGLALARSWNIGINDAHKGVSWDRARCTDCGACLTHCPTDALHIRDTHSREIAFDGDRCIECLACLKVCPFGACSSVF